MGPYEPSKRNYSLIRQIRLQHSVRCNMFIEQHVLDAVERHAIVIQLLIEQTEAVESFFEKFNSNHFSSRSDSSR